MKTKSKLFLFLLFIGLTGNVFAMQRKKRKHEGGEEPAAKKQNSDKNCLLPKGTIAFGVKRNKRKCNKRKTAKLKWLKWKALVEKKHVKNYKYKAIVQDALNTLSNNDEDFIIWLLPKLKEWVEQYPLAKSTAVQVTQKMLCHPNIGIADLAWSVIRAAFSNQG